MIMDRERELIREVVKCFVLNGWVLTPEGIWGFIQGQGENVDLEIVVVVYREIMQEGIRR